jgi:hypothetical protein
VVHVVRRQHDAAIHLVTPPGGGRTSGLFSFRGTSCRKQPGPRK